MPRYELIEGSSKKFWEISLEGSSFTTTYGRIGTEGQSSMKEYESEEKAKKEYDKLIAEKTKKGYGLVDGAGTASIANDEAESDAKPKTEAKAAPVAEAKAKAKSAPAAKSKKPVFDDEGEDEDEEEEKTKPRKVVTQAEPKAAASDAAEVSSSKSDDADARYFEFIDGASSKFWEIKLEGTSFTTRYGKIGSEGQISMKEYESEEKAKRECDKLVSEKTKKGYVEK